MTLQRTPHDPIHPRLVAERPSSNHASLSHLSELQSRWRESGRVTSPVVRRRAASPRRFRRARSGKVKWSDVWPRARLLTNEPVEDVKHHLANVKSLSASSKIMPSTPNTIDGPDAVKLKNSDMISGSKPIWHGHLDVWLTALYTWHKTCQVESYPWRFLFWHRSPANVTARNASNLIIIIADVQSSMAKWDVRWRLTLSGA